MWTLEKPLVAFYAQLATTLIHTDPLGLTSPKNLMRDCEVLQHRIQHEGISFLTKTLPSLGKAVLAGIEIGAFPVDFRGFPLGHSGRPLFLGEYHNAVFDEGSSGDKQSAALKHILQVCFLCYKLEIPYAKALEEKVLGGFVKNESDLSNLNLKSSYTTEALLVGHVFESFKLEDVRPKHGPGAVASGEKLWEKWDFKTHYNQIHQTFPYYDFFFHRSMYAILDLKDCYKALTRSETGCARVVLVPKDSRGPRLISAEPLEYQYIQQGIAGVMVPLIEKHILTKGHVNFTDQGVNQSLALRSSMTRVLCTIDLKDASDRVSVELVKRIFAKAPILLRAILSTRTTATQLPDGSIVQLNKFAPMGSALCFPVQAICYWAICVTALIADGYTPRRAIGLVYVYGDDILVPTGSFESVTMALEAAGLLVNSKKCYRNSSFRESCGMDAFNGVQVTPLRLHKLFVYRRDGESYAAHVHAVNALRQRGYLRSGDFLLSELEHVYGPVPVGIPTSPFPCLHDQRASASLESARKGIRSRWNHALSATEYLVWTLRPTSVRSKFQGWQRLLQNFLQPRLDPEKWIKRRTIQLVKRWRTIGT